MFRIRGNNNNNNNNKWLINLAQQNPGVPRFCGGVNVTKIAHEN